MTYQILIVEDEENARTNYSKFLTKLGYEVFEAPDLAEARRQINLGNGDIVLLDINLPDGSGLSFLEELNLLGVSRPPTIVITGNEEVATGVEAIKNGAMDFVNKPFKLNLLEVKLEQAKEIVLMRRELSFYRRSQETNTELIIGNTPKMLELDDLISRVSESPVTVLISGESGTGKELVAQAIHRRGARKDKPFIPINCSAIQETLIESELFGYEKGAFTGAEKKKIGLMESANNGILFLDEISAMDYGLQAKLLRAIQEQKFFSVGGTKEIEVDIQIISASNQDLIEKIKIGEFREDLYYRLNTIELEVPPLRERKEDIPQLVGLFIQRFALKMGRNIQDIDPKAMELLINHTWVGNIRELEGEINRAIILCDGTTIKPNHLSRKILAPEKTT